MRAKVLGRHSARDREDEPSRDSVLERVGDLLETELLPVEIALHQRLVGLHDLVEQLLAVLLDEPCQLVRNRSGLRFLAAVRTGVGAHVEHIHDPGQLVLAPDGELDCDAALRELALELAERAEEVRPLAIEHVDEEHARQPELVGALPDPARPHLDTHHAAQDEERPLDDAERAARLTLEARIAGHVDEVQLAPLPVEVRERERDRHPPLLLVVVPVADRRAALNRPQAVQLAGLEEKRFDQGRLAGPTMADDGDVAELSGLESGHTDRSSSAG